MLLRMRQLLARKNHSLRPMGSKWTDEMDRKLKGGIRAIPPDELNRPWACLAKTHFSSGRGKATGDQVKRRARTLELKPTSSLSSSSTPSRKRSRHACDLEVSEDHTEDETDEEMGRSESNLAEQMLLRGPTPFEVELNSGTWISINKLCRASCEFEVDKVHSLMKVRCVFAFTFTFAWVNLVPQRNSM